MKYTRDKFGEPICKACDITVTALLLFAVIAAIVTIIWNIWAPTDILIKALWTEFVLIGILLVMSHNRR